jgi:hypothetical protein
MDEIPNDNTNDFDFRTKKSNKNLLNNLNYNNTNDDKENFETNFKNKNNN